MATLTESSIASRKGVRYTIYSIIIFFILRSVFLASIALYKRIFPPAPTPPNVAFSKLPKLPFPETTTKKLNFILETPEGELPTLPYLANVYLMPKTASNLLSLDFAKDKAKSLGYETEPQQMSESIYKFKHKSAPSFFETNIVNGAFSISFDLNQDPSPINFHPPLPEVATNNIKSFLSGASLYPTDLAGPIKYKFLKTQAGGLVTALSQSDANIVRIDMFRKNINEIPAVSSKPNESNVWFMVSGVREKGKDIVAGEYHYYPVDESQVATYPIKTSDIAWQELISGNYYPASYGKVLDEEVVKIRKIYLAYYDAGVYTEFYQPVIVLEGDKDFIAYIPAVTNDYYGE